MGKQAFPTLPSPFSVCFANPRSEAPRTAALLTCAEGGRRFCCGKNERDGTPLRRRDSGASASAATQAGGRPGRLRRPGRAKRAEKERGGHRGELARIRGIHSLFRIACRNKPTKTQAFGWVLGRGFGLQSRLPNVSPYFTTIFNNLPGTKMNFMICLSPTASFTASLSRSTSASSFLRSAGTMMRPRILPLI